MLIIEPGNVIMNDIAWREQIDDRVLYMSDQFHPIEAVNRWVPEAC